MIPHTPSVWLQNNSLYYSTLPSEMQFVPGPAAGFYDSASRCLRSIRSQLASPYRSLTKNITKHTATER